MSELVTGGVLGSLGVNAPLFFGQLVNFVVILFIVWRWVYRPLLKLMDERDKKIRDGLAQAELADRKMSEMSSHTKRMRVQAERDAEQVIDEATKAAEEKRRAIMEESQRDLDRQLAEAKARLAREKETTLGQARQEIASLVTIALERVVGKIVSGDAAKRLVDEAIKELDGSATKTKS